MRNGLVVLGMLVCAVAVAPAAAQVSVGIGFPNVSIGINLPVYPQLVAVPGYPVYYAPRVNSNYFFYDGMYWVYQRDNWYASSWYNGPWGLVAPEVVPLYVLRVPVRYYRQPPAYFQGWQADASPRWGDHWGNAWVQSRSGWDQWNRSSAPAPAPLPVYQRQYSGAQYPQAAQQVSLHSKNYRYQPQDPVVRQQYQAQGVGNAPAPAQRVQRSVPIQASPQTASAPVQHQNQQSQPGAAPRPQPQQVAAPRQQPQQVAAQHQQSALKSQSQDAGPHGKADPQAQKPGHGQKNDGEKADGQDHKR